MSAIPYEEHEQPGWDALDEDETLALPRRPRRQFVTRGSMAVLAVLLCAAGFYAGVRVEKGQVSSNPTATLAAAASRISGAFASRLGGAGSSARTGGSAGGFAGRFGGSGNSSIGTVSSINGRAIYITETATGNVIKVSLSSATKITKNVGVGKSAIRPGDSVVVQGVKGSGGTISATSLSDSGAGSQGGSGLGFGSFGGGTGGGAGGGSGGRSGGGAGGSGGAVNSLFGGGGAG